MRLHRLEMTAIGPFAGTETLDLDAAGENGLFLLHGPTGAGKTTVLDAICFAIFGRVPGSRGAGRPRLRSDHAPADREPRVLVELTVAGRRLEVVRTPEWQRPKRRGTGTTRAQASTTVRERVAGSWQPLTNRNDEAGHLLQQLVGMGVEQFTKVVLLPQGEFAAFLRADAETRTALLSRLFEIDQYTGVEEWLGDERRRVGRDVGEADRRTAELVSRALEAAAGLVEDEPAGPEPDPKPLMRVEALVQRAEVAVRNEEARVLHTDERLTARRHELASAEALTRLQQRWHSATIVLADLEAAEPELHRDRARVTAARRAAPVGPLLAALSEPGARWSQAAQRLQRCATLGALRSWLAPAGLGSADAVGALTVEDLTATAGPEIAVDHVLLDRCHRRLVAAVPSTDRCRERQAQLEGRRAVLDAAVDRLATREQLVGQLTVLEAEARATAIGSDAARALAQQARTSAQVAADRLEAARRDLPDLAARETELARARSVAEHARQLAAAVTELESARASVTAAIDADQRARDRLLSVREQRLEGIAAELARALEPGCPCPVCGSPVHPGPRRAGSDAVDREAEQEAARAAEATRSAREQAANELSAVQSRVAELSARSEGLDAKTANAAVTLAEHRLQEARVAQASMEAAAAGHRAAAERVELCTAEATAAAARLAAVAARLAEARGRLAARDEELRAVLADAAGAGAAPTDLGHDSPVDVALDGLDGLAPLVTSLAAEVRGELQAVGELLTSLADLEQSHAEQAAIWRRLQQTARHCGFSDVESARAALLTPDELDRLATRVEQLERTRASVRAELSRPELIDAADRPAPDVAAAEAAVAAAEAELRSATAACAVARRSDTALHRLHSELLAHETSAEDLRQQFASLDELSRCVDGTGGGNSLRMRLSAYVLAARLEQVASAATERLDVMSGGRYALRHSDQLAKGGARSGLALRVLDGWTGVERDTATLSGGESFLASLALALGLADVVQAEAGGASIETLFVDEGFGTLDEQTLDEVMTVLDGLRDGGRSVGLVSHVAELRQRIPNRVEVVKGRAGSRLVVHDSCA